MNKFATIAISIITAILPLSASDISGSWRGNLSMGSLSIPLVLNFSESESGDTKCTLDSPQQNVKGMPMTVNYISADSVAVSSSIIGAVFSGHIEQQRISGEFKQRGYTLSLNLTPEEPLTVRRPQTPQPPFPYTSVDTTFVSTDDTELAGTIVLPENFSETTPIVVMVTGSGPQNRDEEIFEHKPFAVLADALARAGIASLRYDDRGVNKSDGFFEDATIDVLKNDAESALHFARKLTGGKAGILGHSEGGSIALLLAADKKPDFIISLAGVATSGKETMLEQNRHLMEVLNMGEVETSQSMPLIEAVFDEIEIQVRHNDESEIDVVAMADSLGLEVPEIVMSSLVRYLSQRNVTFDQLVVLDVRSRLGGVKCPVLALNGTLDKQVNAESNLSAIEENIPSAEVHKLDGLNHLLQHAESGEMSEYADIRETISPEAIELIIQFIKKL